MLLTLGMDPRTPEHRLRLGMAGSAVGAALFALLTGGSDPLSHGQWFFAWMSVMTVVDYRDNVRQAGRPPWEL